MKRSWCLLDSIGVVVIAAGTTYLLIGPGDPGTVDFPTIQQKFEPDGRRSVTVNNASLRDAFARAGLPDPPDLNGADPVPVDRLMGRARTWVETGDAAALGCFAGATDLDRGEVRWRYGLGIEC